MSWHFTEEERAYLRANYQTQTMFQMSKHINRHKSSVSYQLQTVLKLKVPEEVIIKNRQERKEIADAKAKQRYELKLPNIIARKDAEQIRQKKLADREQRRLQRLEKRKQLEQMDLMKPGRKKIVKIQKLTVKVKKVQAVVQKAITRRVDKKPPPAQKLRIADFTSLLPVRIDHKTIVYVKPGADVAAILKQYQNKTCYVA
jgi:hypothetical protein